jgi:hypothetical protein
MASELDSGGDISTTVEVVSIVLALESIVSEVATLEVVDEPPTPTSRPF